MLVLPVLLYQKTLKIQMNGKQVHVVKGRDPSTRPAAFRRMLFYSHLNELNGLLIPVHRDKSWICEQEPGKTCPIGWTYFKAKKDIEACSQKDAFTLDY